PHPAEHVIWGRKLRVPKAAGKAAWLDFNDLCGQPLGAADYLELTRIYRAFVVVNIPRLKSKDFARRFITFLDSVYDSRVYHKRYQSQFKYICADSVSGKACLHVRGANHRDIYRPEGKERKRERAGS